MAESSEEAEDAAISDLVDCFGTPPTRSHGLASARGSASRQRGPGSSTKFRHTTMVPGAQKISRVAKQSMIERKKSKDKWQKDRGQARAFKVLDPMLLDVLGIEDSHKEAATPAGDATGLSSPVSGSFLQHSFGSQAELSSQQLEECRGSGDMKRLSGHRPGHRSRSGSVRSLAAQLPSPTSGRSSPAPPPMLQPAPHHQPKQAPRPAPVPAGAANHHSPHPSTLVPGSWAMTVAAPARPPSAPPVATHRSRTASGAALGTAAPPALRGAAFSALPSPVTPAHHRQGSGGRNVSMASGSTSGTDLTARDRMAMEREAWSARISHVLARQGEARDMLEEAEAELADAKEQAVALREQLIVLQTTSRGWVEVEERLKWLEDCRAQAAGIMRRLHAHRSNLPSAAVSEVRSEYSADLSALCEIVSLAVEEALEGLAASLRADEDVRIAMRVSTRTIQACVAVAKELRDDALQDGPVSSFLPDGREGQSSMERCAARVVQAALTACRHLAQSLLQPSSLTPPVGHATAAQARCMHALWRGTTELLVRCVRQWEGQALELNRRLGEVYCEAARLALAMITDTMCDRLGRHQLLLGSDEGRSFDSVLSLLVELDEHCVPSSSSAVSSVGCSMVPSSNSSNNIAWPGMQAKGASRSGAPTGRAGAGAWGLGTTAGRPHPSGGVANLTDEELLAHSWVPSLLLDLHSRAGNVHRRLRELLSPVSMSGGLVQLSSISGMNRRSTHGSSGGLAGVLTSSGTLLPGGAEEPIYELLDELQERFSTLVLANLQRTAWLCGAPAAPAMWALEVLRDQAENALRLAKAYDAGTLGLEDALAEALDGLQGLDEQADLDALDEGGETGDSDSALGYRAARGDGSGSGSGLGSEAALAERRREYQARLQAVRCVFDLLKSASDHVVNALLHIRRQLRVRRADQEEGAARLPARLPTVPALARAPPVLLRPPVRQTPARPASVNGPVGTAHQHSQQPGQQQQIHQTSQEQQPQQQQPPRSQTDQQQQKHQQTQQQQSLQIQQTQQQQLQRQTQQQRQPQQQMQVPQHSDNGVALKQNGHAAARKSSPFAAVGQYDDQSVTFEALWPSITSPSVVRTNSTKPSAASPVTSPIPQSPKSPSCAHASEQEPLAVLPLGALSSSPAVRTPSCDPSTGASWYGDLVADAANKAQQQQQAQPPGGTSWRAVVAPMAPASGHITQAADTATTPTTAGPAQAAQLATGKPTRQGSSLLTQQLQAAAVNGSVGPSADALAQQPQSSQAESVAAWAGALMVEPIDEDQEEEAAAGGGESTWQQPRTRRRTPRPATSTDPLIQGLAGNGHPTGQQDGAQGARGGRSGRGGRGVGRGGQGGREARGGAHGGREGRGGRGGRKGLEGRSPRSNGSSVCADVPDARTLLPVGTTSHGSASSGSSTTPMQAAAVAAQAAVIAAQGTGVRPAGTTRSSAFSGFNPFASGSGTPSLPGIVPGGSTPKLSSSPVQPRHRAPPTAAGAPRPAAPRHTQAPSPFLHAPSLGFSRSNSGQVPRVLSNAAAGFVAVPDNQHAGTQQQPTNANGVGHHTRPQHTQPSPLGPNVSEQTVLPQQQQQQQHHQQQQQQAQRTGSNAAASAAAAQATRTGGPAGGTGNGGGPGPAGVNAAGVPGLHGLDDTFWTIPFSVLRETLTEQLGSGSFGTVWRGRYINGDVAIKVVNIDRDALLDEQALARFRREVDFQRRLSHHPNIVRFIGACCEYERRQEHGLLAIVMEYCMLGNLFKMVSKARQVGRKLLEPGASVPHVRTAHPNAYAFWSSWETRLQVAAGAAAGVQFMHHHSVVHRDLTSNNLVLDRAVSSARGGTKWVAKVCDFNLSRVLPNAQQRLVSSGRMYSPLWASPELLGGRAFGKEADVYSFGIILWEILTLNVPYGNLYTNNVPYAEIDPVQTNMLITNVSFQVPIGLRPELPQHAAQLAGPPLLPDTAAAEALYSQLVDLISRCWDVDPGLRPEMAEVANVLNRALETIQRGRSAHASAVAAAATAMAAGQ